MKMINLVQDRDKLCAAVNTVIKFQVCKILGIS